jgi:hypothetical protein
VAPDSNSRTAGANPRTKRTNRPTSAALMADPPLPSFMFGNNDEIEKLPADRRAGWEGN